jgi:hypothetical protein
MAFDDFNKIREAGNEYHKTFVWDYRVKPRQNTRLMKVSRDTDLAKFSDDALSKIKHQQYYSHNRGNFNKSIAV